MVSEFSKINNRLERLEKKSDKVDTLEAAVNSSSVEEVKNTEVAETKVEELITSSPELNDITDSHPTFDNFEVPAKLELTDSISTIALNRIGGLSYDEQKLAALQAKKHDLNYDPEFYCVDLLFRSFGDLCFKWYYKRNPYTCLHYHLSYINAVQLKHRASTLCWIFDPGILFVLIFILSANLDYLFGLDWSNKTSFLSFGLSKSLVELSLI